MRIIDLEDRRIHIDENPSKPVQNWKNWRNIEIHNLCNLCTNYIRYWCNLLNLKYWWKINNFNFNNFLTKIDEFSKNRQFLEVFEGLDENQEEFWIKTSIERVRYRRDRLKEKWRKSSKIDDFSKNLEKRQVMKIIKIYRDQDHHCYGPWELWNLEISKIVKNDENRWFCQIWRF